MIVLIILIASYWCFSTTSSQALEGGDRILIGIILCGLFYLLATGYYLLDEKYKREEYFDKKERWPYYYD